MEMDAVLEMIGEANDEQISRIIDAITDRYKQVYPEWEIAFLALPLCDEQERKRVLEFALKYGPKTLG